MRKIAFVVLGAAVLGLGWYLFIKSYDYRVAFEVNTSPGTIHEEILDFAALNINLSNKKSIAFETVSQQLKLNDSVIKLDWKIEPINDSVSKVIVDLTDRKHSLANRLSVPFSKSVIEKIARRVLIPFKYAFDQKLTGYRVEIVGEESSEEVFCACIPLQSTQKGKAFTMMSNNFVIDNFLNENKMKITGNPFLKINKWLIDRKGIEFDFCFPTTKKDSLPESPVITFKTIPAQKSIKAVYYGNYKSSDKAWYALYGYAKRNNLEITLQPREVFLNNPNTGGDDKKWRADIYMPLEN